MTADIRHLKIRGLCETLASAHTSVAGVARALASVPGVAPRLVESLHAEADRATVKAAVATERLLPFLLAA
ncbi:MAG: hypothetical protein HC834_09610, partial [Rhodospirillales bacterium]|nr:hypothetical protein [Rhodospirillales bacterium]